MLYFMRTVLSYISNNLLNSIQGSKLRRNLNEQLNFNCTILTYEKAKKILHNELNNIDIYGDNTGIEKNIEHIFPQCLFKKSLRKPEMKSDIHNLYLCNSKLNSQRSNFKYISHEDYIENNFDNYVDTKGNKLKFEDIFVKQGYIMLINKKKKEFIPTVHSRGMISRSLAYFVIKYDIVDQLTDVISINNLIEWNIQDPPRNEEYYKNIISYKYQNNYNPFILDSDLMIYAFSDMYDIDKDLLNNKKVSVIDPMYSIEILLKQINYLERENKLLSIQNKKMKNKIKKD